MFGIHRFQSYSCSRTFQLEYPSCKQSNIAKQLLKKDVSNCVYHLLSQISKYDKSTIKRKVSCKTTGIGKSSNRFAAWSWCTRSFRRQLTLQGELNSWLFNFAVLTQYKPRPHWKASTTQFSSIRWIEKKLPSKLNPDKAGVGSGFVPEPPEWVVSTPFKLWSLTIPYRTNFLFSTALDEPLSKDSTDDNTQWFLLAGLLVGSLGIIALVLIAAIILVLKRRGRTKRTTSLLVQEAE